MKQQSTLTWRQVDQKLFPTLTPDDLKFLSEMGESYVLEPGELLFRQGEEITRFCVILDGELKVTKNVGGEDILLVVHTGGGFVGEVTMLAGGKATATGKAITQCQVLCIPLDKFRQVVASGTPLGITILKALTARRPEAEALVNQREKLMSLGKFSAGVSHELNNPAAAGNRSASQLLEMFGAHQTLSIQLGQAGLAQDVLDRLLNLVKPGLAVPETVPALERSDREADVSDWLDDHGIVDSWKAAPSLVDAGLSPDCLETLFGGKLCPKFPLVIRWMDSSFTINTLLRDVYQSTSRISDLVKSIKAYSYMDSASRQEVDVRAGIDNTLIMLRHKMKDIEIVKEFAADLPKIWASGGELNQVWTNLIDNAADALNSSATENKQITLRARREGECIAVEICDNGPGIPPEVTGRIFDPFFTTKGVGEGTGLGLDACYRIVVRRHKGDLEVKSQPGDTRFQVWLPISSEAPAAPAAQG